MWRAVAVVDGPFLLVFWGAGANSGLDRIPETHVYAGLLFTVSTHWSQYLSMTAIPLPTSNKASFVASWPHSLHVLRMFETLLLLL